MYKIILRRLNFLFYLLFAVLFATVQTTVFSYFPLHYFKPDLLLILAVYLGLKRSPIEGGLIVIVASMILEAHSGTVKFFFMSTYLYVFIAARLFSSAIVVTNIFSTVGMVLVLTILKRLGVILLLTIEGKAQGSFYNFLIYLVPGILIQALATPICFGWFYKIDLRTFKDEHAEDEYDINKGAF